MKQVNKEEFIKGVIYPDSVKIKGETHYSPYYSSDVNLYEFLHKNPENIIVKTAKKSDIISMYKEQQRINIRNV